MNGVWKVKKVFSRGAQLLAEKIKNGQDVRVQIISKIDDPDAYGSERLVIENACSTSLLFRNSKIQRCLTRNTPAVSPTIISPTW